MAWRVRSAECGVRRDHPSQEEVRYAKCQQKPQQQQKIILLKKFAMPNASKSHNNNNKYLSLGKGKMPIQKPFNETPLS
eukprot:scaffold19343_cov80-Cyclotella_meneghiniana.AAC.8